MTARSLRNRRAANAAAATQSGRANQRLRTRKDLLEAAGRLLKHGRVPSLEEIADEAMVSRATAYRYFSSIEDLLTEASTDAAAPDADTLLGADGNDDPVTRLERVEAALHKMISANEAPLRIVLARSLERRAKGQGDESLPVRQNRRTPLIEKALEPARGEFDPGAYKALSAALALVLGTESMVVFRDVLQMKESEAQKVRRWAIRALVEAAKRPREAPIRRSARNAGNTAS